MVHDYTPADIWWHDAMNDFSIISDGHPLVKSKNPAWLNHKDPGDKLPFLERRIQSVEIKAEELKTRFKQALIGDGYRVSHGEISADEYASTKSWYDATVNSVDLIVRSYRGFRMYMELSPEEYGILYTHIGNLISNSRELIRDRYVFERELDRRSEELERTKEIETVIGT